MPRRRRASTLSIAVNAGEGGVLPTEFRLFVAGWNETAKGSFLFDAEAAASVMAAYRAWGVDLAIDLEHQMLDADPSADPTARDARGWCRLELRSDGSLWAVDVRWTPDGAARLAERRQRYVSPAFSVDPETMRVTEMINVAITAMPATHHTPALVAAAKRILCGGLMSMDPKMVGEALDALVAGDAEKCAEILKGLIASAAAGDAEPDPGDPAEPAEQAAGEPAEMSAPPAAEPAPEEEKPAAVAAASARLMRLSGASSFAEAVATVETWRASHVELEGERQKLAAERATLEAAERRRLCAELVSLGAEFPATVWADDAASQIKPRWAKMEIAELRAHVAEQREARGGTSAPKAPVKAPAGGAAFTTSRGSVTLSASELAECKRAGAKPEVYAENKAARLSRKGK